MQIKLLNETFCVFEHLVNQNLTNQDSQLPYSSRPYGGLLENPKTWDSRELFLPENDFKTCSAVIFPKKHPGYRGLETNKKQEIQT